MPDRRVGAAMVATVTIAAVGCAGSVEPLAIGGESDVRTSPPLVQSLCRIEDPTADPKAVREAFDAAHGALHELAAEVTAVDRDLAGRLHAEHRVEMALRSDEATAGRRSAELRLVVHEALRALDRDAGACQAAT